MMNIKQVVVTGQNEVELQEITLDETLAPGEVLIETETSFISAGTELANYTGVDPEAWIKGTWSSYPWKSGYANVGTIIGVGDCVTRATIGQRVFTFGTHGSYIKMDQDRMIIEVPERIDSVIGVASRMAGVAATGPFLSEIRKNAWVVVYGLGMVGNLAAQMYRILGCRVIGVDPIESRRKLAEKCGLTYTIGGTSEEVKKQIVEITGEELAQITVDAVGHSRVIEQAVESTGRNGQIVLLGSPRAPVEGDITAMFRHIHGHNITVRGAIEWCLPHYSDFPGRDSLYSKQQMIFDWIERGELILEPQISHRMNPKHIKEAYDGLLHQSETYTGVVLEWQK